jgi:Zn-dependent protease with chaperone function
MFLLLGIAILLASLLTVNSLASLALASAWRVVEGFSIGWSAEARAGILFLLRIAPAALSMFLVVLFLTPAYLVYEPRATPETVSLKLAALAVISLVGIGLAVFRGLAAWRATRRLTADWKARGKPVRIDGVCVSAYLIEHTFPIIAIVGALRPRLFIARRVLAALTPDEIVAALAHESGHLAKRDNLKRGLLRACRDSLLIIPCGRSLDSAWAEASECAADEYAAREGRERALDLASALVKIARMVPGGARPTMPAGAFLLGDESSTGVKWRVRRLVQLASSETRPQLQQGLFKSILFWASAASFVVLITVVANTPLVLLTVHSLIERAVLFLE